MVNVWLCSVRIILLCLHYRYLRLLFNYHKMQNRWFEEKRRHFHYTGPETKKSALQELRCSTRLNRPKVEGDICFWPKTPNRNLINDQTHFSASKTSLTRIGMKWLQDMWSTFTFGSLLETAGRRLFLFINTEKKITPSIGRFKRRKSLTLLN